MIKRTVEISREPAHVSVRHDRILLEHPDDFTVSDSFESSR